MSEEDEIGLPQKGLNMIIKDVLPDLRIANESRELLNQCCVEFVKHISREAQRISSCDQRKTIYHEHVQKALLNLGFPADYAEAANSVLDECKIAAEKRLKRKKSRLDKCGIPEEQLYLMQQELIEKARREEAEKQQQQQQILLGGQQTAVAATATAEQNAQNESDLVAMMIMNNLIAAQNNPELLAQLLASIPPEWAAVVANMATNLTMTNVAAGVVPNGEVKAEAVSHTPDVAENASLASEKSAMKNNETAVVENMVKGEVNTDVPPTNSQVNRGGEDTENTAMSSSIQSGSIMSNDMRERLAANFVASLKSGDNDEDFD